MPGSTVCTNIFSSEETYKSDSSMTFNNNTVQIIKDFFFLECLQMKETIVPFVITATNTALCENVMMIDLQMIIACWFQYSKRVCPETAVGFFLLVDVSYKSQV